jgi:hypothetical protein
MKLIDQTKLFDIVEPVESTRGAIPYQRARGAVDALWASAWDLGTLHHWSFARRRLQTKQSISIKALHRLAHYVGVAECRHKKHPS